MSNSTSLSEEASASSEARTHDISSLGSLFTPISPSHLQQPQPEAKKKRSQPGNPDPGAEVVALSPKTLMATNRFVCEICNKGFQRDQNLQLHRRGHNLPWKLRQRSNKEVVRKRVYVCPEVSCVHHQPSRALGDLTGIKKHFCRKHGEKKWRCDKCSKRYAVHSDWKAHIKTCGTREYRCDCGTLFPRKDSFVTHKAFCEALAEESARLIAAATSATTTSPLHHHPLFHPFPSSDLQPNANPNPNPNTPPCPIFHIKPETWPHPHVSHQAAAAAAATTAATAPCLSTTALLQKPTTVGPRPSNLVGPTGFDVGCVSTWQGGDRLTRDFLGVDAGGVNEEQEEEELLSFTGLGLDLVTASRCDRGGDHTRSLSLTAFGFPSITETWGWGDR